MAEPPDSSASMRRAIHAAAVMLGLIVAAPPPMALARQALPQTPKAYIRLTAKQLELLWNGDRGEQGRGQGEVMVFTLIHWAAPVEKKATQEKALGPLGGAPEVDSGTIVEGPPGQFRVEPAIVTEGLGEVYHNRADCPVPNQVFVHVKVWDDDNNTDVKLYTKLILDGIKSVVDGASSNGLVPLATDLVSQGLFALVDWLTWSRDDMLGEYTGNIAFPDPCAGTFPPFIVELGLDTRCADLWISDAADQNGVTFTSKGIPPPAQIGKLDLQIIGGLLSPDYASSITPPYLIPPPDTSRYWRIARFDIGQPEECRLTGALDLKASLPAENPLVDFGVYLDTDHDIATGAPSGAARGAEYQIELPLGATYAVVPLLFRYDHGQSRFVPVSGAMVSSEIDLDRGRVFLSTDLASIGAPNDSVAAWATSESSHGLFLSPPDAAVRSPVVTIQEGQSGLPPTVSATHPTSGARDVPITDSLVIEFEESMNEVSVQSAFSTTPHVSGVFSSYGNRFTFRPSSPLEPGRVYTATLNYWATDCAGNLLDGDGDLNGGDAYEWTFTTRPRLLMATNPNGAARDRFVEGDFVHARGDQFPPNTPVAMYVMRYDVGEPAHGTPLVDFTDNGPEQRTTSLDGFTNVINLGRVLEEGEYNVIVDVNPDGFYGPSDRIDRSAIGFAVLPSGVDGKRNSSCAASTIVQTTQTNFGNSNLGQFDHANGSELDAACAVVEDGALKLFLAGNLESNFNKLEIFIDCLPGGQNRLRGDNSSVDFGGLNRLGDDGSGNGLTFDSGFLADFWIGLTGGGGSGNYRLYTNYAELRTNGGGPGFYVGETIAGGDGTLSGGYNVLGIRSAIDNSNTAGISGGCGAANGDGVATGIEVLVPLTALGNPTGCIRICALVNATSHDFLSNQVLGPLPSGTCNLGEPRTTLLGSIPGNQFFQVCVPTTDVEPVVGSVLANVRAWPNPFRNQISIELGSAPGLEVEAEVFEVTGRRVRVFPKRALLSGRLVWDGRGDRGQPLPAGLYLVRLRARGIEHVVRVLRLR